VVSASGVQRQEPDFAVFTNAHPLTRERAVRFTEAMEQGRGATTFLHFLFKLEWLRDTLRLFVDGSLLHSFDSSAVPMRSTDRLYVVVYFDYHFGLSAVGITPRDTVFPARTGPRSSSSS
jgi:hypothetical protein